MTEKKDNQEIVKPIAESTLGVFSEIYSAVSSQIDQVHSVGLDSFASMNTFTHGEVIQSLGTIIDGHQKDIQILYREPAIARIVTKKEDGEKKTYFICRASPPISTSGDEAVIASYKAPIGRLASLPVGSEFELILPNGTEYLEVLERAELHPAMVEGDWDSVNSTLEGQKYGPLTVISFLELLKEHDEEASLLDRLLAEEEESGLIFEGIRRSVITKMGLRDQPILDEYQDAIFRLPLDSRLLILGPPGSGKTTTLIRRLGQKLSKHFLDESELKTVEGAEDGNGLEHESSWIMFTPTELLKQYLKEAFAREGIAAPDQRLSTWSDYRRELARNQFNILKTSTGGGSFVMKETLNSLQESTLTHQIDWYEDFQLWLSTEFRKELREAAQSLSKCTEPSISVLGTQLATIMEKAMTGLPAATFASIGAIADKVKVLTTSMKSDTDNRITRTLNYQVNHDRNFLDDLAKFIDSLKDLDDDPEDQELQELEDEEELRRPSSGRAAAAIAYANAIRSHARAQVKKRRLNRAGRSGRIVEWLGERSLDVEELRTIGESLQIQSSARKFLNPHRRYLGGVSSRYRRFRRLKQEEGKWYQSEGFTTSEIGPLEVDIILLSILHSARELMKDRRIFQNIDEQSFSSLRKILDLAHNQVMVDEVTDFSPIQIACMWAISNPRIQSFYACGDFNQRITNWGSRLSTEIEWAVPNIDIKSILLTYRHTKQLSQLAKEIVHLCGGEASNVVLPENIDNEGVQPVLAKNLNSHNLIVDWLAQRIVEIERFVDLLPSVAVLVNAEQDVGPIASGLNEALVAQNIRVVACHNGLAVGQENDIRVFDVQYIKGLEFEAVFFVGIDQLAKINPTLFDKYLYVGTTRAATYLGLTCTGNNLPQKISPIEPLFISSWEN